MIEINKQFPFIMISAMYENGGNTTHRLLDGHPEIFVYPFESQLGTKKTGDYLASVVPHKYRWPQYLLNDSLETYYEDMWDEEVKICARTPHVSKFRDAGLELNDFERKDIFLRLMQHKERTTGNAVAAFFVATFEAWKNYNKTGKEKAYLGYNPVAILDGDRMINDLPNMHVIHVVRNPFSAYAETKHRPFPLSLNRYIMTWNMAQMMALSYSSMFPKNIHVVRFEDIISDKKKTMTGLMKKLGLSYSDTLLYPSFNGKKLENVMPWGTVQQPTIEYNINKAKELSKQEHEEIKKLTSYFVEYFKYQEFI